MPGVQGEEEILRGINKLGEQWVVMPGLVPGIHVLLFCAGQDVDGRDKPAHDERNTAAALILRRRLKRLRASSDALWRRLEG